jgi:pimeloyl-ACP methyl ester carboxylesterase
MKYRFTPGKDGERISAVISVPESASHTVVMTHGFAGNKEKMLFQDLEFALNQRGIATMRYDMYGHGASEGSIEELTLSKALGSLKTAVSSLRDDTMVPYEIALFGYSFGGSVSMVAASQMPDVNALVTASAVSDPMKFWTQMLGEEGLMACSKQGFVPYRDGENEYKISFDFITDISTYNTAEMAKSIECPTLIMHGDSDPRVPIEQSHNLADILDTEVSVVPRLGHGYDDSPKEYREVKALTVDFLASQLS